MKMVRTDSKKYKLSRSLSKVIGVHSDKYKDLQYLKTDLSPKLIYRGSHPEAKVTVTLDFKDDKNPKAISRRLSRILNNPRKLSKLTLQAGIFIYGCISPGYIFGLETINLIWAGYDGVNKNMTENFNRLETIALIAIGHCMKKNEKIRTEDLIDLIAVKIKEYDKQYIPSKREVYNVLRDLKNKDCISMDSTYVVLLEEIYFELKNFV